MSRYNSIKLHGIFTCTVVGAEIAQASVVHLNKKIIVDDKMEKCLQKVKKCCRNEHGFSIAEVMVAVSIIGILAVTYIGYEIAMRSTRNMHAYGRDLLSNAQLAKLEAIKRNTCVGLAFDRPNSRYWVFTDDGTGAGGVACNARMDGTEQLHPQYPAIEYRVPGGVTMALSPVAVTVADPNFTTIVNTDLFDGISFGSRGLIRARDFVSGAATVFMNGPTAANTTWWARVVISTQGGSMQYQTNDNPVNENRWSE